MPDVAITQHDDIAASVDEALGALDIEGIIRGRIVAVKPNDTWASPDDITGVTQGDTLRAVLRHIMRYDPKHIVVSGGAGAAETDDVFRYSGMMEVVNEEGVEFFDHNRPPFTEIGLQYEPSKDFAGPQQHVLVNPRVLSYQTLISLAQLKLHATATVTLTMKNVAMSFPAADYYGHPRASQEYHRDAFFDDMHSFIVAMNRRFPITLGIIAGHPAMIATGPLGGKAVETGMVIASSDPVAADAVGAKLLGFQAQAVRYLWEAGKIGLGETQPSKMNFPRLSLKDAIKSFTRRVYGVELTFEHA